MNHILEQKKQDPVDLRALFSRSGPWGEGAKKWAVDSRTGQPAGMLIAAGIAIVAPWPSTCATCSTVQAPVSVAASIRARP